MVQSIKGLLHIRNIEDFKGIEYVFSIIIIGFIFFLSVGGLAQRILAHLLMLFWISINTCQLCTIFRRKKCEHIFLQSPITANRKVLFLLIVSSIENLGFFIFSVVQIVCFMDGNLLESIIFSVVHFYFSIAIGMLCGYLCQYSIALIVVTLFYGRCFLNSWWTTDEHFRYISPTVQLYNVQIINITNLYSLILISIVFIVFVKYLLQRHEKIIKLKVSMTICISIVLIGILISRELYENKSIRDAKFNTFKKDTVSVMYKGIDKKTAIQLTNILRNMEDELQKLNIVDQSNQYVFNRYYISYLYSLYRTRPIPITKENDTIHVNIFSDAMINLHEPELIQDFLERSYTQIVKDATSIDNNYTYQIIEGCKEVIFRKICIEDKEIYSQELQDMYDRRINLKFNSQVTPSNYIKKISSYMYLHYPSELSELYNLVSKQQISSNEEFIQLFKKNFSHISNIEEVQLLMQAMSNNE